MHRNIVRPSFKRLFSTNSFGIRAASSATSDAKDSQEKIVGTEAEAGEAEQIAQQEKQPHYEGVVDETKVLDQIGEHAERLHMRGYKTNYEQMLARVEPQHQAAEASSRSYE